MAVLPALAQGETLVRVSDPWRYFKLHERPVFPRDGLAATGIRRLGVGDGHGRFLRRPVV